MYKLLYLFGNKILARLVLCINRRH